MRRKWSFVGQEARRLAALGLTPYAIAKRLDLNPSTVQRWKHAGKFATPTTVGATKGRRSANPAQWAEQARRDYALDATDVQLVTLGQQALEIAYDKTESSTRLAAIGRFQAIANQLAFAFRHAAPVLPEPLKQPERPVRRSGVDPRNVLKAVN